MSCYRCGARTSDPVRGPSPWRRGVREGRQVLVCPTCQAGDWQSELDRCSACDSTALVRRLGEIACRSCGAVASGATTTQPTPSVRADPALGDEVAQALARLFRRG